MPVKEPSLTRASNTPSWVIALAVAVAPICIAAIVIYAKKFEEERQVSDSVDSARIVRFCTWNREYVLVYQGENGLRWRLDPRDGSKILDQPLPNGVTPQEFCT